MVVEPTNRTVYWIHVAMSQSLLISVHFAHSQKKPHTCLQSVQFLHPLLLAAMNLFFSVEMPSLDISQKWNQAVYVDFGVKVFEVPPCWGVCQDLIAFCGQSCSIVAPASRALERVEEKGAQKARWQFMMS